MLVPRIDGATGCYRIGHSLAKSDRYVISHRIGACSTRDYVIRIINLSICSSFHRQRHRRICKLSENLRTKAFRTDWQAAQKIRSILDQQKAQFYIFIVPRSKSSRWRVNIQGMWLAYTHALFFINHSPLSLDAPAVDWITFLLTPPKPCGSVNINIQKIFSSYVRTKPRLKSLGGWDWEKKVSGWLLMLKETVALVFAAKAVLWIQYAWKS